MAAVFYMEEQTASDILAQFEVHLDPVLASMMNLPISKAYLEAILGRVRVTVKSWSSHGDVSWYVSQTNQTNVAELTRIVLHCTDNPQGNAGELQRPVLSCRCLKRVNCQQSASDSDWLTDWFFFVCGFQLVVLRSTIVQRGELAVWSLV